MAGKSNGLQTGMLQLIFNAKGYTNIADNTATSPSTSLWIALHTADPTNSGNQTSSETTYTGYLRVATARTTGATGWSVSGSNPASASPNSVITFATCTASSTTLITNFSVGLSSSGTGTLLYDGTVTSNISITTNVTASLTTASVITED